MQLRRTCKSSPSEISKPGCLQTTCARQAIAFTAKPPAALDRDYCAEIRKTCSSVCRNLAEGFGRRRPSQFLPFVVIALGSLAEVQDQLVDATRRGYLTPAEFEHLWALSNRVRQTSEGLRQYLARCVRRSKHRRNARRWLERQEPGS